MSKLLKLVFFMFLNQSYFRLAIYKYITYNAINGKPIAKIIGLKLFPSFSDVQINWLISAKLTVTWHKNVTVQNQEQL